jgi:Flp pilus assembly pilin Flp
MSKFFAHTFFAQFISHLKRFIASAGCATAIEWVMIAALLGIVLVASASPITDSLRPHLDSTADSLVDIRTHE